MTVAIFVRYAGLYYRFRSQIQNTIFYNCPVYPYVLRVVKIIVRDSYISVNELLI